MDRPIIKSRQGPEAVIQERIIEFLRYREWFVKDTHGNMYQSGFPDLYATHSKYGQRWIEVKNLEAYSFTPAQLLTFPQMCANGSPIWILCDATEAEYMKLWKPCNWYWYLINSNTRACR